MKGTMSKLMILAFFMIGLMAVDLPFKIGGKENLSYVHAFGRRPGNRPGTGTGQHRNVPEPTIIILLAGGVAGVVGYRYLKNNKKPNA